MFYIAIEKRWFFDSLREDSLYLLVFMHAVWFVVKGNLLLSGPYF